MYVNITIPALNGGEELSVEACNFTKWIRAFQNILHLMLTCLKKLEKLRLQPE